MSKTVLITGASSGIGYELAYLCAAKKMDLVLIARSENKLQVMAGEMQQQFGVKVYVLALDLSNYHHAQDAFNWCQQQGIVVDYLVNNAGFGDFGFFHERDWTKQEQMINLNITTLTYLTHLFLPGMILRKSGRIMNVASTASFVPGPLMSVYYATKAFVLSFSEALGEELKDKGVTVTALCPGATESGFAKLASMEETPVFKNRKIPTSKDVAVYGLDAMLKGKRIAVYSLKNKLMVFGMNFVPRGLLARASRFVLSR
jgi:uncharacterized protein